ncbi:MAG: hypothetical protein OEQ53_14230 [Saprospiraceae bacterium]|nr:hypothetical protein [Saprospiraceae bacterium]
MKTVLQDPRGLEVKTLGFGNQSPDDETVLDLDQIQLGKALVSEDKPIKNCTAVVCGIPYIMGSRIDNL